MAVDARSLRFLSRCGWTWTAQLPSRDPPRWSRENWEDRCVRPAPCDKTARRGAFGKGPLPICEPPHPLGLAGDCCRLLRLARGLPQNTYICLLAVSVLPCCFDMGGQPR